MWLRSDRHKQLCKRTNHPWTVSCAQDCTSRLHGSKTRRRHGQNVPRTARLLAFQSHRKVEQSLTEQNKCLRISEAGRHVTFFVAARFLSFFRLNQRGYLFRFESTSKTPFTIERISSFPVSIRPAQVMKYSPQLLLQSCRGDAMRRPTGFWIEHLCRPNTYLFRLTVGFQKNFCVLKTLLSNFRNAKLVSLYKHTTSAFNRQNFTCLNIGFPSSFRAAQTCSRMVYIPFFSGI